MEAGITYVIISKKATTFPGQAWSSSHWKVQQSNFPSLEPKLALVTCLMKRI